MCAGSGLRRRVASPHTMYFILEKARMAAQTAESALARRAISPSIVIERHHANERPLEATTAAAAAAAAATAAAAAAARANPASVIASEYTHIHDDDDDDDDDDVFDSHQASRTRVGIMSFCMVFLQQI